MSDYRSNHDGHPPFERCLLTVWVIASANGYHREFSVIFNCSNLDEHPKSTAAHAPAHVLTSFTSLEGTEWSQNPPNMLQGCYTNGLSSRDDSIATPSQRYADRQARITSNLANSLASQLNPADMGAGAAVGSQFAEATHSTASIQRHRDVRNCSPLDETGEFWRTQVPFRPSSPWSHLRRQVTGCSAVPNVVEDSLSLNPEPLHQPFDLRGASMPDILRKHLREMDRSGQHDYVTIAPNVHGIPGTVLLGSKSLYSAPEIDDPLRQTLSARANYPNAAIDLSGATYVRDSAMSYHSSTDSPVIDRRKLPLSHDQSAVVSPLSHPYEPEDDLRILVYNMGLVSHMPTRSYIPSGEGTSTRRTGSQWDTSTTTVTDSGSSVTPSIQPR